MRYFPLFLLLFSFSCSSNRSTLGSDLGQEKDASIRIRPIDMGGDEGKKEERDTRQDIQNDVGEVCLARHSNPTPEGHPSDGWVWQKLGRVFEKDPQPAKATQGDFSPSVVKVDEGYRLYFARRRDEGWSIFTSKSSDGRQWQTPEAVKGIEGHNVLSAHYQNGEVRLWFGSGSFATALSNDGVNFTDQVSRVLSPSDVGDFGKLSLLDPKVWVEAGVYKMWFGGFDGQTFRIAKATSANGVIWNADKAFLLERTGGNNFDSTSVASPHVRKYGDTYYMWYGGYDTSKTDPGPWRIGLATSQDGTNWVRKGVTIPLSENGDDMWSTRDAAVFKTEAGTLSMIYVGMSDDSHYRLLSATTESCF